MKHNSQPFKWRHYEDEIILLCVRWYCRFQLSYRDLEEIMQERGLTVDHSTIFRWVQRYAPEINKRIRPHLKLSGTSYRIDETYVKVGKSWRWRARQVFRTFHTAERTIEGIEALHMMHKSQVKRLDGRDAAGRRSSL